MLYKWHSWLDMKKYDEQWHANDLAGEFQEYTEEKNLFKKWSELSDIVYTCTRARWTGYALDFPFNRLLFLTGTVYMIPKYTGRWLFFRAAGKKAGAPKPIHEVRNPKKFHKLKQIADRNNVDPDKFIDICKKQSKYWPLLP